MNSWSELYFFFEQGELNLNILSIEFFRVLFGISLFVKYAVELQRKFPKHTMKGSFLYHSYIVQFKYKIFFQKIYYYSYHLRLPLIFLLILGYDIRIVSFFLFISYFSELFCLFQYHIVVCCVALFSIFIEPYFDSINQQHMSSEFTIVANAPGLVFIKYLPIFIYLSSSLRKIQHSFWEGFVLEQGGIFSLGTEGRKHSDHFAFIKSKIIVSKVIIPHSKKLSIFVIFTQLVIPIFLLLGGNYTLLGFALGLALHTGIAFLFPVTLSFFTLMMYSILILWL